MCLLLTDRRTEMATFIIAFLSGFAKLRKETLGFAMSVRLSAWKKWGLTGRIFVKLDVRRFFENLLEKNEILLNFDNNRHFT
jgi:hypothetical protein